MIYVIAAIIAIIAVELYLQLSVQACIEEFVDLTRKSIKVVVSKRISDHWKEKVVPFYAVRMFLLTLKLTMLLFCILAGALLPAIGMQYYMSPTKSLWVSLAEVDILLLSCFVAFGYYFVRRRCV